MNRLYTYDEAARLLGLTGKSSVKSRIDKLAARGIPLTIESNDLQQIGARRLITDKGLERLRQFEKRKAGRRPYKTHNCASNSVVDTPKGEEQ